MNGEIQESGNAGAIQKAEQITAPTREPQPQRKVIVQNSEGVWAAQSVQQIQVTTPEMLIPTSVGQAQAEHAAALARGYQNIHNVNQQLLQAEKDMIPFALQELAGGSYGVQLSGSQEEQRQQLNALHAQAKQECDQALQSIQSSLSAISSLTKGV